MKKVHFTDLHQHVLWGIDDGPQTRKQMRALLRQDAENGIEIVFATSHAYPKTRPFDYKLYRKRLKEANEYCESKGWDLRVLPGCEIHYCSSVADRLTEGKIPTLGNTRYVLIEFSTEVSMERISSAADRLYCAGYLPVIAHVERYNRLVRSPKRAIELRDDYGLLYQMNCDTILHPHGFRERRFVKKMLEEEAIDAIATDAHDVQRRPVHMMEAYRKIARDYDPYYARQLVRLGKKIAKKGQKLLDK